MEKEFKIGEEVICEVRGKITSIEINPFDDKVYKIVETHEKGDTWVIGAKVKNLFHYPAPENIETPKKPEDWSCD